MSVVIGYSSDSDSENDDVDKITDIVIHSLLPTSSNVAKKTIAGEFQQEMIDPVQFKRNKRLFNENELDLNNLTESKKIKLHESTKATKSKAKELKKTRKSKGDPSKFDTDSDSYIGPWANDENSSSENEVLMQTQNSQYTDIDPIAHDDIEFIETSKYYGKKNDERSIFDLPKDYQIRFATTIAGQKEYFIPKKLLSSYKAHESSVTSLEFLPGSGHMLLSSGNDGMVKLWSTTKPKTLIRDYHSHNRPVKHATFSETGHEFISCSYDKTVKIWDTEMGVVAHKNKLTSNPNMSCFVPNTPSEYMVALDSRKVEHFDWRSGESIQTYEHHQSSVTWIEFINDGTQFITASDDRTLKIWDIRINMPIKYIQDPKQQAMPIVKKHPRSAYFVGQSMDNQILVYSTKQSQKFRKNNQKSFSGHNTAAYAIQMGFSPDGKTLLSGDSKGYCYFWDWKSTKLIRRIKASENVISCVDFHPLETSLVSMAGYDGNIYLYS